MVGVMLKRNDTDVGWWRWVEKGVSRFCHTPSALRARPPVSGGQSGCGRFFWLCPSKLGGRGAKRRRGYVSFPFSVSRFPFLFPFPFSVISYPLRPAGSSPLSQGDKVEGHFFLLCPSKLGGRGAKRRRGYVSFPFLVFRLSYPSALWARPLVSSGQSGWPVSFIAAAVEIGLSPSTPPPACSSCAASRREVGRQG